MTAITPQGFVRTRLDERLTSLVNKVKGIFGEDIDLSPDSMDGETLGVFAEAVSDLDQLAEDVYQGFDPDNATGVNLASMVQLNGIRKLASTFTTVDLHLVGIVGTSIPKDSIVKSSLDGTRFFTLSDVEIPDAGYVVVTAEAEDAGAVTAPANSVTVIDTPLYGWQTATNPDAATPGRDAEKDEELRIRRRASTSTAGQAIVDAVYSNLANLPGVTQVRVYENDKDDPDPETGQAPHSMHAIVVGGDAQAIGKVLWLKKSGGCTLLGNQTVVVDDSQGFPHDMKFSRPPATDIWIVVNTKKVTGYPTDGNDRIKAALVQYGIESQKIGGDVINGRLYTPVNTVPGHGITSIFIGTAEAPTTEADISILYDRIAAIDASRITVNAV